MPDTDDMALWFALNQLMADYWGDVDGNDASRAHEFYLPDAVYAVGETRFEGADMIRDFYTWRRKRRGGTRHLIHNLRVVREDAPRARTIGMMSLYHIDGTSPAQGAKPPSLLADFEAGCLLGDDGRWRFRSHVLRPFFIGEDAPSSMLVDIRRFRSKILPAAHPPSP